MELGSCILEFALILKEKLVMIIGVPTEIKVHEYRVGLVPSSVKELVKRGHDVLIQSGAGIGINVIDKEYEQVGAKIVATADEIFSKSELIVKVKEPQVEECKKLLPNQTIFTYLHLAPEPEITSSLVESKATAIAYETVTCEKGRLPLLAPMSEVAGRLSVQVGAHFLEKANGGRGVLLGGVPGVPGANVVIIGGGVVGTNALKIAIGMGADVTVLDKSINRLTELDELYGWKIKTQFATTETIERNLAKADLVIGAVLIPGASAPKIITRDHLKQMKQGSVIVDVAIDQGGCIETSKPTTYSTPVFTEEGVVHYCVANMPGGVPRTSAFALNNATLPYIIDLADKGYKKACKDNEHLLNGVNVWNGHIAYEAVAKTFPNLPNISKQAVIK